MRAVDGRSRFTEIPVATSAVREDVTIAGRPTRWLLGASSVATAGIGNSAMFVLCMKSSQRDVIAAKLTAG